MASKAPAASSAPPVWRKRPYSNISTLKSFKVARDEVNGVGYKADVLNINGRLYAGLTRMIRIPNNEEWIPTRKSIYLPAKEWRAFAELVPTLSRIMLHDPSEFIPGIYPEPTPNAAKL